MSGLVMMVGGAIVNALALCGSNYMFSKLRSDEERERHNRVMEKLTKARDAYEKQRIANVDFINKTLRQQGHADRTFTDVDDAMNEYILVTGDKFQTSPPPDLSDY